MGFRTYKIDREKMRIVGQIDGAEAYWQRIQKALSTDKFYWLYYDQNYGLHNMQRLIGKPVPYCKVWIKKYVIDCCMKIDGTIKVDNFVFKEVLGRIEFSCVIWSSYGSQEYINSVEV